MNPLGIFIFVGTSLHIKLCPPVNVIINILNRSICLTKS